MGLNPSMEETIRPSIIVQGSGREVPCMVVVERFVRPISDDLIFNIEIMEGSMIVILAWSSSIAKSSMVNPLFGYVSCTGHVLLYEDARKTVPWAYF